MNLVIHRPNNKVADPRARSLEARAPFRLLLEPGNHFSHNTYLRNVNGQAPQYGLGDQTHHHPERGQLHSHLGVVSSCNCIPSYRGAYGGAPVMVMHSSNPLRCRRVSSLTSRSHCSSAATHHRSAAATLSTWSRKLSLAASRA
jgi:hypothetical protein